MISRRAHRTIRLLQLLQQQDGITLKQIADWLNCSQRTVYRDLHVLRQSGFQVEWSDSGYRVAADDQVPQGFLDGGEMLALLIAVNSSANSGVDGFSVLVKRALQKLLATASSETQSRWDKLTQTLNVDAVAVRTPLSASHVHDLPRIANAIEMRRELKWRNHFRSIPQDGRIVPRGLAAHDSTWFVDGHDPHTGLPLRIRLDDINWGDAPRSPIGSTGYPISLPSVSLSDKAALID